MKSKFKTGSYQGNKEESSLDFKEKEIWLRFYLYVANGCDCIIYIDFIGLSASCHLVFVCINQELQGCKTYIIHNIFKYMYLVFYLSLHVIEFLHSKLRKPYLDTIISQ